MRLASGVDAAVALLLFLSAALLPAVRCDPQTMMAMVSLGCMPLHPLVGSLCCTPWSDTHILLLS